MSMDDKGAVHQAIQLHRYNPEILPNLEAYVDYQITEKKYDFEANLAILKLYQFFPDRCNMDFVAKILAKALMALPTTDFLLSTYLISEQVQIDNVVKSLCDLATLLEGAQFKKFWDTVPTCPAAGVLQGITDFEDNVREFISGLLLISHQTLDLKTLSMLLNMKDAETAKFVASKGWASDGTTVSFPLTNENQAVISSTAGDKLQFGQLKNLLATMS